MWPEGQAPATSALHELMTRWIQRQDALDRKRNHFLRDFRGANGFDRNAYAPDVMAAYEAGLEAVNAEVREGLRAAADALLALPA